MRQYQTNQPLPEKEVPAFPLIQEQVPAGKDSSCRQRPFPKHRSLKTCARRSCTTAAHRFLNRPDSRNFFSELTERKRNARICPDRSPLRISFSGPAPSFRSRTSTRRGSKPRHMPSISGHGPAPRPAHRRRQADAIRGLKSFRDISASHTGPQFRPARLPATRRQFRRTFLRHAELLPGTLPIQVHVRKNCARKRKLRQFSPAGNVPCTHQAAAHRRTGQAAATRQAGRRQFRIRRPGPKLALHSDGKAILRISFSGPAPSFRSRIPRTHRPQVPQPQTCREIPAPHARAAGLPERSRIPTPQPPERSGKLFRGDLLQLSRCRSGTRASRNAVTASARSFPFQAA